MITELTTPRGTKLYYTGPSLADGPLPTLFYFALSGEDSLGTDPYNQPVQFLQGTPLRIFSLTLPLHDGTFSYQEAIEAWTEDLLLSFFDEAEDAIRYTERQGWIQKGKLALAGLSRGGLIASHLTARLPEVSYLLGFAPVTRPRTLPKLDLLLIADKLCDRHVRFYIGNRDERVSTRNTTEVVLRLAELSSHRSPQIELILTPSIGQMGHGTSFETFSKGAEWIATILRS